MTTLRMLVAAGVAVAALAYGPAARADRCGGGYVSVSYGRPAYYPAQVAYSYSPAYPGDSYVYPVQVTYSYSPAYSYAATVVYPAPVAYSYTPAYPGDSYAYQTQVAYSYSPPAYIAYPYPSVSYAHRPMYYPPVAYRGYGGYAPAPIHHSHYAQPSFGGRRGGRR